MVDTDAQTQPLFDKQNIISINDESGIILTLHSTEKKLNTYSAVSKKWFNIDLTNINDIIAEGVTTAISGLVAPHKQLKHHKNKVDLTWTHGSHPFSPFGSLSNTPSTTIMSTAVQRSIIASRSHSALHKAGMLVSRTASQIRDVINVMKVVVTNLMLSNETSNFNVTDLSLYKTELKKILPQQLGNAYTTSLAHPLYSVTHSSPVVSFLLLLQEIPLNINEQIFKLTQHLAAETVDFGLVLTRLEALEKAIQSSELSILRQEKTFQRLLSKCKVIYHGKSSVIASPQNTVYSAVKDSVTRVLLLILIVVILLILIYRGIIKLQKHLEMKIKKSK